jgi:hypothetical protein
MQKDPVKLGLWRMWNTAHCDSRNVYGYEGPNSIVGQAIIHEFCQQNGRDPSVSLRLVPINPNKPMLEGNICIVSTEERTLLLNIWKNGGNEQIYKTALSSLLTTPAEEEHTTTKNEESSQKKPRKT